MTRHEGLHGDRRERVLEEAKQVLWSSTDCEANLARVARLAVPVLADGCVIHLLDDDGILRFCTAFHSDAEGTSALQTLHRRDMGGVVSEQGPWNVLRTGESELLADAGTHYLARAGNQAERQLLERLDLGSSLSAPMIFHERQWGAITLFTSRYGRRLAEGDLALVQDLARCAAVAAAHAHSSRESNRRAQLNDELLTAYTRNLRSPLGSVHVWLELLRSEKLGPSAVRAVAMIDRSIRHLTDLVSQMVDVSHLVTGSLKLDKQPTDLPEILDAELRAVASAAREKRLRVELEIDRPIEWLWADPQRLRQALRNLLSNAVKFTPSGGAITVRLERRGGRARIEVRDTGIGIPPNVLPGVLGGFREGGSIHSGLGLAIARRIAELHDGTIGVESEGEGRGSVFAIELPLDPPPRP
jgi:signal transduction histidine kinase